MPARLIVLGVIAALACAGGTADARIAPKKRCGTAKRQFTDGSPRVFVAKGSTTCRRARSVMRRYWSVNPSGRVAKTVRVKGVRWHCQTAVPPGVPLVWACRTRNGRSVVTAAE